MKKKYNPVFIFIFTLLMMAEILYASLLPVLFPIPSIFFQILLYGTLLLVLIIFLKKVRIEMRMLLFVIVAAISLILSDADARYNSSARFFTWLLLLLTIGPLFYNSNLIRFRNQLFDTSLFTFMLIGGFSFLYWLAGFPNLGRGHFTGLMNHSMQLAPIASLGGVYAFYQFTIARYLHSKYIFIGLTVLNVLTVLLAASRIAFISLLVGLIILLFFNKFRFRKLIISTVVLITIAMGIDLNTSDVYIPDKTNDGIASKILERGLKNTREELWDNRVQEFKANPFFGVGFATQDDKLSNVKIDDKGHIEPGSTYLMVLSMTGVVGAFAMCFFFLKPILSRNFWKRIASVERYKLASYGFFSIHFIAEGYIFSSGSLMAFIFWLLVGATYPYAGYHYNQSRIQLRCAIPVLTQPADNIHQKSCR